MSWSLRVSRGDLVLDSSSLGSVAHEHKLVQDLRLWLMERMGHDQFHPNYGSLIDGGTTPEGKTVDSVIGSMNLNVTALEIEAEIRRVGAAYQRMQIDRARSDRDRYGKSTLTGGEILAAIKTITFDFKEDRMDITVLIESARGNEAALSLNLPGVITTS